MSHPNKKLMTASAAMVGLSAFVPNPMFTNDAMAQATATVSLSVKASVTNPLGLKSGTELDFGTFAIATTGTIKITAGGGTAVSNGFVITAGQAGSFTVTAPAGATFTLSVTKYAAASNIVLTAAGGGAASKSMTLSTLAWAATSKVKTTGGGTMSATLSNGNGTVTSLTLATVTKGVVNVGGQLVFNNNQVTGGYSTSYTLLVTF